MNKKLGALLFTATLATGCDSQGHSDLVEVKNDISRQVTDTIKKIPNFDSTVNNCNNDSLINFFSADSINDIPDTDTIADNSDYTEKGSKYDELIQKFETPIIAGDLTKPEIAITIDDGCGGEYTDQILDTLAKYNVKATFFIPGTRIKMHAKQRRRAIQEGHQVCCHSYDHHYFKQTEPEKLDKQISDWKQAVKDSLGEEDFITMMENFPFFRYPGGWGDSNPAHTAVLKKHGFVAFGRTDCTRKKGQKLNNGDIILYHVKPQDFQRITDCIKDAQEQGLRCKLLSEIVTPDSNPITRKNIGSKRKEAKKIIEEWKINNEEN